MSELSESVVMMMKELEKLPGIGRKSAERITWHLLKVPKQEALDLANSILNVREKVRYCKNCYNLSENDLCEVCQDSRRDQGLLCIVEQPRDLIALEETGHYNGLYHVLWGRVSPLDHIDSDNLTIDALVKRIKKGQFRELIMATNPTMEGDATALVITNELDGFPIKITRLARGITTGSTLEFANKEMLSDAISSRQNFKTDNDSIE